MVAQHHTTQQALPSPESFGELLVSPSLTSRLPDCRLPGSSRSEANGKAQHIKATT